jgi:sulfide:quinone oxidoreductase
MSGNRVLIAGGGIAGLEALLALRDLAGDRAEITLAAPDPSFLYKPWIVEEPFSDQPAEEHELAPIVEELGGRFVQQPLAGVDPAAHRVELGDGSTLDYDYLVVCVGAKSHAAFSRAITFRAGGERLSVESLLRSGGEGQTRVAFVVPPRMTWPLPIYELALMTRRVADAGAARDAEICVVTPESAPLLVFGSAASAAVQEILRARSIEVRTGIRAREGTDGQIVLAPGEEVLEATAIVALPEPLGPAIPGLPQDGHGFLPIDEHARVDGVDDVYAAGDGTNFPIKQGGLGTQQADAAAEDIAARLGADIEPRPFNPVLRGKLLTGDESVSLKHQLSGGTGEGTVSEDYLWWPPHKVSGRYLAPWLAGEVVHDDPEPPRGSIDVEVSLPKEWHREPMALDPYGPIGVD